MSKSIQTIEAANETKIFNSCRFCATGRGVHKVSNSDNSEVYYLCEAHKKNNPEDSEALKNG